MPARSTARPRALFLSPEAPYPLTGGGPLRSASLLEYTAGHYDTDLILFRQPGAPDPSEALPRSHAGRVCVLDLPHHSRSMVARTVRNMSRLLRGSPPLIDRFAGFDSQIAAFVGGSRYDLAIIEHFWCAPYIDVIRPSANRVVVDLHNIESVWHSRVGRSAGFPRSLALAQFARACTRLEQHYLPRFDTVLAASGDDARRIAHGNVIVYPNALPSPPRPERREQHVILFTGNLQYEPNVEAIKHFYGRIWPRVRQRSPGLMWRIAGRNPESITRLVAGDPRIEVRGPMEDALRELASAKVAIVPLLSGSGTRIKILEAWAAGTPVISTTLGAEGLQAIPGEHLLLVDDPGHFAEAVAFLVDAPEARAQLAEAGRRLLDARYTWESAWKLLDDADFARDVRTRPPR